MLQRDEIEVPLSSIGISVTRFGKKILVGILYWANLEPTLALLKCNWQIFVALNGQILKKSCHPVTLIWIVLKTCVASHLT